jgi:hypothetical protein
LSRAKFISGPDTRFSPQLFAKSLVRIQHTQEKDGSNPYFHLEDRVGNEFRLYPGRANLNSPGLDIAKQVRIEFVDGTQGVIVPATFPHDRRKL